jgi:hypothetical protein
MNNKIKKKRGKGARSQRGGKKINEFYSKTKENQSWGMLPGNQRRVTSPQRLKQPMK